MERKEESAPDFDLGGMVYRIYDENKHNPRSKKMANFQLKYAFTQGNLDAINEVKNSVKLYLVTERDDLALPFCKILYFNDKKGLEITLNFMLYRAVKNDHLENAQFLIESRANVKIKSEACRLSVQSINRSIQTNVLPPVAFENNLLHVACSNNSPEMATLLLTAGVPVFEMNRLEQTPREVNALCFDKAWLSVHTKIHPKKEDYCKKLGITTYEYDMLTTQAEDHLKEVELRNKAQAEENLECTVIKTINDRYEQIVRKDKKSSKLTLSQYKNFFTIKAFIIEAYKNEDKSHTTINHFFQENTALKVLKELNYITYDNKLNVCAPEPFKQEFNALFPPLDDSDFVFVPDNK